MQIFCRIVNIRGLNINNFIVAEWFYDKGDAVSINTNISSPRQIS